MNLKALFKNRILLIGCLFGLLIFILGLFVPDFLKTSLNETNTLLLSIFSSYYLWAGFLIVLIAVILVFLPFGKQKLGNTAPEYTWFSWIALLYSTGMGSGLLLRAVQEPVFYMRNPPISTSNVQETALQYTFFHWGFTPWSFYSLFGLIVAYNMYIYKSKSLLNAIISDYKNETIRNIFNIFIVLITIIGVVASLGLGTGQFIGGINAFFGTQLGTEYLLITLLLIGVISTLSALTGIQKAIKYLADFDMLVSITLLLFVGYFLDFSSFFIQTFHAFKNYIIHFPEMSLAIGNNKVSSSFLKEWTVFYWAFWLAWVPFTGIFIARISKGRSIRAFLIATILVPTLATVIWFAVFGNMAFQVIGQKVIYEQQFDSIFTSLFNFLHYFPFSEFTILVTALLVLIAIINSVDSAIFVVSMFSDDGSENPSNNHKFLWGIIITSTSIGITAIGTQDLLSSISNLLIIMALPFSFIYLYLLIAFLYRNIKLRKTVSKSKLKF